MPQRLTPRQILDRLVAFRTVSRDSNLDLVDWVEDYLAGWGVSARRVYNAEGTKAALYASVGPDVAGGVVLSGHTDVVPVAGQNWSSDPWSVVERDGRLFGRGVCDMKGFDALASNPPADEAAGTAFSEFVIRCLWGLERLIEGGAERFQMHGRQRQACRHGMTTKAGDQPRIAGGHGIQHVPHMDAGN